MPPRKEALQSGHIGQRAGVGLETHQDQIRAGTLARFKLRLNVAGTRIESKGQIMTTQSAARSSIDAFGTPVVRRSRLTHLPVLGDMVALFRFFRDPRASMLGKLFLVACVAYVVWPADAIPDVIPVVGWLDDFGVAALAIGYVSRVVGRYRK